MQELLRFAVVRSERQKEKGKAKTVVKLDSHRSQGADPGQRAEDTRERGAPSVLRGIKFLILVIPGRLLS
jgi:hypothetical protein